MSRKVGVVTGGSSGIGLALVRHLLKKKWRVVAADTRDYPTTDDLNETDFLFVKTDVSSWEDQHHLFKSAYEWASGDELSFLAANAGAPDPPGSMDMLLGRLAETGLEKPNMNAISVNIIGEIYSLQLFAHYVRLRRKRSTSTPALAILTSSGAGLYPMPSHPIYCASKHAVIGYTRSIAPHLAAEGINVNCICPGFVDSGITAPVIGVVPKEYITSMEQMMAGYDAFLEDVTRMSGQVMEITPHHRHMRSHVSYLDEEQRWLGEDSAMHFAQAFGLS